MLNVPELLEKAVEYDRVAGEAKTPAQKRHYVRLAKVYRFLAQQQAIIDEQTNAPPAAALIGGSSFLPARRFARRRNSSSWSARSA